MKKYYKVFIAGLPEESEKIFADSPLEAVKKFFIKNQFNNSIVVKWGFWGSKTFLPYELKPHFNNIDFDKLEYKKTEDKTSDLDKFANRHYGAWRNKYVD